MNLQKIITNDGSHSLLVKEMNETYHSRNGALAEANHVFIKHGLNHLISEEKTKINVLEIGFGTGLNAFLTALNAREKNLQIIYHSIENFPLNWDLVNSLNYAEAAQHAVFEKIHQVDWNTSACINAHFQLMKIEASLLEFDFSSTYDLIYFDAFAPNYQPEMWTISIFEKMYNCLNPNGIIVTYCAKGEVRRRLIEVGFSAERLEGPPGKREMLRGTKN